MFERLETPEQIFSFKLGSLLTAERDTLAMLGELEQAAQRPELKALLRSHADETQQQIENVSRCFELLGEQAQENPSPVTKGMDKEGKASLRKTADDLVDAVILVGALETEHYEIAVYESLINNADARGAMDVKALLEANLAQEEAARDKIKALAWEVSHSGISYDGDRQAAPATTAATTGASASGTSASGASATGTSTAGASTAGARQADGGRGGDTLAQLAQEGPVVTDEQVGAGTLEDDVAAQEGSSSYESDLAANGGLSGAEETRRARGADRR